MNDITETVYFPIPLTSTAHQMAEYLSKLQSNSTKAKRVYLNTLTVYAVNSYLQCMGVETDLSASDSQDTIMTSISDAADLEIKNIGKLECIPVLPNAEFVYISPEVWSDRIGYIAVQLNESLSEAILLGFVKKVSTQELSIRDLNSLEDFLKYWEYLSQSPISLSQWLQDIFEPSWQSLESLLSLQLAEPAFSFRGSKQLISKLVETSDMVVQRCKLLKFRHHLNLSADSDSVTNFPSDISNHEQFALLVGLMPASESEIDIRIKVYPIGNQTHLPQALEMKILDEEGITIKQALARGTENLELKFSGLPGDRFDLMVALGDDSFIEPFLI